MDNQEGSVECKGSSKRNVAEFTSLYDYSESEN